VLLRRLYQTQQVAEVKRIEFIPESLGGAWAPGAEGCSKAAKAMITVSATTYTMPCNINSVARRIEVDVHFTHKAMWLLRSSEMTRWANLGHTIQYYGGAAFRFRVPLKAAK
jgi:hypothetical protein